MTLKKEDDHRPQALIQLVDQEVTAEAVQVGGVDQPGQVVFVAGGVWRVAVSFRRYFQLVGAEVKVIDEAQQAAVGQLLPLGVEQEGVVEIVDLDADGDGLPIGAQDLVDQDFNPFLGQRIVLIGSRSVKIGHELFALKVV